VARIAYFYREMSEYIAIDLRLLGGRHDVTVTECSSRWPDPLATWRTVAAADAAWSWFASWHALLPGLFARLQGKPFVLCTGGYDTARLPGIGYGHRRDVRRALVARAVMALATKLLVVSDFAAAELSEMGVRDARVTLVPHGLDPARYGCEAGRDPALVVTVGGVNQSNRTRKGLEPFVRAARELPGLRFVLVGAWMDDAIDDLRAIATPNVTFTGELTHDAKADLLARAAVVVQASQHEAFGLSLAEGMLAGAVPVVTAAGALPWVAGGTGVVAASQEPGEVAKAVREAVALGAAAGRAARRRVLDEFSLAARERRLEEVLAACGLGAGPDHEAAPAGSRAA
jgi:glycosyltransferase involved in cell wall biosynthesis